MHALAEVNFRTRLGGNSIAKQGIGRHQQSFLRVIGTGRDAQIRQHKRCKSERINRIARFHKINPRIHRVFTIAHFFAESHIGPGGATLLHINAESSCVKDLQDCHVHLGHFFDILDFAEQEQERFVSLDCSRRFSRDILMFLENISKAVHMFLADHLEHHTATGNNRRGRIGSESHCFGNGERFANFFRKGKS